MNHKRKKPPHRRGAPCKRMCKGAKFWKVPKHTDMKKALKGQDDGV